MARVALDRADQMQGKKTDHTGMREDRDLFALVGAEDVAELAGCAAEQVAVALAIGYHVMDVAVNQRVVIFRMCTFGFIEGKAFKHADMALAEGGCGYNGYPGKIGERFCGLHCAMEVAGIDGGYIFFCEEFGRNAGLFDTEVGQRCRAVPAKAPLGVSGGLSVSDKV